MNPMVKYGLIAAVIAGFYFYGQSSEYTADADDIDLNAVLDITADTLYTYDAGLDESAQTDPDAAYVGLAEALTVSYNAAQPALHTTAIGVLPLEDASLIAYEDINTDQDMGDGEEPLFQIEIDGEGQRIIASSRSGAVNDHHFSGTSLLAGYLIGSMLSRQRAAGVSASSLASKKTVTARSAARTRAGSGSHSRGK